MAKVYIAETKRTGRGLFAAKDIKKDEKILTFKGPVIRGNYYVPSARYNRDYPNAVGVGYHLWINTDYRTLGRYINHSCNPNAGMIGKVRVVAMKLIKKGEEVTMDYSISEEGPYWQMKCHCGQKNCRKIIKNICSLPKSRFNEYLPYIPKYFQSVYNNKCGKLS